MAGYRPEYTFQEQKRILNYIIEKEGVYQLRGIKFWKDMEESGEFQRTWQSLKEHFRKKIYPELHLFKLPDPEYTLLKNAYGNTAIPQKEAATASDFMLKLSDSEEEEKKTAKKKDNKSRDYTEEEQQKILRYILDNNGQYQLHGIKFWRDMSDTDEFDRTWQSLKEHFRKIIYRNIENFNLPIKDLGSIKEGYESTRRTITKKQKKKKTEETEDDI